MFYFSFCIHQAKKDHLYKHQALLLHHDCSDNNIFTVPDVDFEHLSHGQAVCSLCNLCNWKKKLMVQVIVDSADLL